MNLNCIINVIKAIVFNFKMKVRMSLDSDFVILRVI